MKNNSDEDIFFDFKLLISQDANNNYKIRKSISSFANNLGGFLFFGIKDKKAGSETDRIIGVKNTDELNKSISETMSSGLCIPVVDFEGIRVIEIKVNEAIKKVAVIKIQKSKKSPHAVKKNSNSPMEFWSRSSGKAEPLDYTSLIKEVESGRDFRAWLIALYLDLNFIQLTARNIIGVKESINEVGERYISILLTDYGNVVRATIDDSGLFTLITNLQRSLIFANDFREYEITYLHKSQPREAFHKFILERNKLNSVKAENIGLLAQNVRVYLENKYPIIREYLLNNT